MATPQDRAATKRGLGEDVGRLIEYIDSGLGEQAEMFVEAMDARFKDMQETIDAKFKQMTRQLLEAIARGPGVSY